MAEQRLIDANAADVERICCYYGGNCYIEDVKEWLDEQPTIDAVPVVRCRDCEHFVKYDDDYRDEYHCDGYCKKIAYIMDGYYHGAENRHIDDFCSRGVKKMDGGAE